MSQRSAPECPQHSFLRAEISVRVFGEMDTSRALTVLIHSAYAPLGARGYNFNGVDQSEESTADRVRQGICFVAECEGALVGTILVHGPYRIAPADALTRDDTACFQQFAVHADWKGSGVGSQLLLQAEMAAAEAGYARICTDTVADAEDLTGFYTRRGYVPLGEMQWPGKTYRSVILGKTLAPAA